MSIVNTSQPKKCYSGMAATVKEEKKEEEGRSEKEAEGRKRSHRKTLEGCFVDVRTMTQNDFQGSVLYYST